MTQLPDATMPSALPNAQEEEARAIEALVAARLEQQLTAQLHDVGKVLLVSTRATCSFLEAAASMGRHELLREILTVFQTTTDGMAPPDISDDLRAATLAAASEDHPQSLHLLLDSCSPSSLTHILHARDARGDTPLLITASKGHAECMRLLLQHSPETQVTARDSAVGAGRTALMHAAYNGHTPCLHLLLAHTPDLQVAASGSFGLTALMAAAGSGHTSCLHLLLAHSPDVQLAAESSGGRSALSHAVDGAHVSCLQLLLAHRPSQQHLDAALGVAGQGVADLQPPPAQQQQRQGLERCIELLLSHGAMLPAQASEGAVAAVRPISQALAARALVPGMANEAVVGLALAAAGNKRQAASDVEDAADPSKHPRTSS